MTEAATSEVTAGVNRETRKSPFILSIDAFIKFANISAKNNMIGTCITKIISVFPKASKNIGSLNKRI